MLTLVCGIPNAGKTTGNPDAIHLDDIGTIAKVIDIISEMENDIVIEGLFSIPEQRRRLRDAYNGYAKCIFIDISADESIRRENRGRPDWMLRNAARLFIPPTYDEG